MIAPIRQDKRHHWVTKQSIGANKFEHSDDNTRIPDKPLSLLATMSIGVGCPYRGFLFIPDVRYHRVRARLLPYPLSFYGIHPLFLSLIFS